MRPPVLQAKDWPQINADERRYDHSATTEKIINVFFSVYNELGFGFLESVYQAAMCKALRDSGLRVDAQLAIPVWFRREVIAEFRADLVVDNAVIIELKAGQSIDPAHLAQTLNYLRATSFEVGLVLNFGPKPGVRRLAFSNERKKISVHQR